MPARTANHGTLVRIRIPALISCILILGGLIVRAENVARFDGVVVIAGAAVAVATSTGGTDRVAEGPDGRFDPQTFPNR